MLELAKRFIGKECVISSFDGNHNFDGIIKEVSNGAVLIEKDGKLYLFYTGEAASKEIVLHFRAVLPAFMVPRKLIQLDAFPRLPNGKLDMNSLKNYFK